MSNHNFKKRHWKITEWRYVNLRKQLEQKNKNCLLSILIRMMASLNWKWNRKIITTWSKSLKNWISLACVIMMIGSTRLNICVMPAIITKALFKKLSRVFTTISLTTPAVFAKPVITRSTIKKDRIHTSMRSRFVL